MTLVRVLLRRAPSRVLLITDALPRALCDVEPPLMVRALGHRPQRRRRISVSRTRRSGSDDGPSFGSTPEGDRPGRLRRLADLRADGPAVAASAGSRFARRLGRLLA